MSVKFFISLSYDSFNLGNNTESAPLLKQVITPCSSFTTTVILFLVELNSIKFNNWYLNCYPLKLITILLSSSLSQSFTPRNLAAFTKANSSGEDAL